LLHGIARPEQDEADVEWVHAGLEGAEHVDLDGSDRGVNGALYVGAGIEGCKPVAGPDLERTRRTGGAARHVGGIGLRRGPAAETAVLEIVEQSQGDRGAGGLADETRKKC